MLKKVFGTWRGTYRYDPSSQLSGRDPVPFTLVLKQGWFGHFTGSVTEDPNSGMPGTGSIDGYFSFPRIEFTKRMPIAYVTIPDGRRMTMREYIIEQGCACERDIPHRPIFYEGEFSSPGHAQGTWVLKAGMIRLEGGLGMKFTETVGTWEIDAV